MAGQHGSLPHPLEDAFLDYSAHASLLSNAWELFQYLLPARGASVFPSYSLQFSVHPKTKRVLGATLRLAVLSQVVLCRPLSCCVSPGLPTSWCGCLWGFCMKHACVREGLACVFLSICCVMFCLFCQWECTILRYLLKVVPDLFRAAQYSVLSGADVCRLPVVACLLTAPADVRDQFAPFMHRQGKLRLPEGSSYHQSVDSLLSSFFPYCLRSTPFYLQMQWMLPFRECCLSCNAFCPMTPSTTFCVWWVRWLPWRHSELIPRVMLWVRTVTC